MHLSTLRKANLLRCPRFRNKQGGLCHPQGVVNWTVDQWFKALVGEIGEFADWSKKYDRGDMTQEEFIREASKELADAQCYLDLLAARLGIDLGEVTRLKFNEVSERIGVRITIHPNGNITDFGDEP
jgi:NTP pyrophosphatase (non-canonical NTP hydrolase)